jgi:hypothetical protein
MSKAYIIKQKDENKFLIRTTDNTIATEVENIKNDIDDVILIDFYNSKISRKKLLSKIQEVYGVNGTWFNMPTIDVLLFHKNCKKAENLCLLDFAKL